MKACVDEKHDPSDANDAGCDGDKRWLRDTDWGHPMA